MAAASVTKTLVYNRRAMPVGVPFVSIMRPGRWGNPFSIGRDGDRAQVIEKYRQWFFAPGQDEHRRQAVGSLRGKALICCCKPKPCHGDVIAEYVDALCPGNCVGEERAAKLFLPHLGAYVVLAPANENGACCECLRSRECQYCRGPRADAVHNTMAMHIDSADGGTGCPHVSSSKV